VKILVVKRDRIGDLPQDVLMSDAVVNRAFRQA
jgi:hypothetical protein